MPTKTGPKPKAKYPTNSRPLGALSRERIRQVETLAMRKMRRALTLRGYKLEDLLELGRPSDRPSRGGEGTV